MAKRDWRGRIIFTGLEEIGCFEVKITPEDLEIHDANTHNCPRCDGVLIREIKNENTIVSDCGCDNMRPFVLTFEPCRCVYEMRDNLYLKCENCVWRICEGEGCDNKVPFIRNGYKEDKLCKSCIDLEREREAEKLRLRMEENERREKAAFTEKFKNASVRERLEMHGMVKLKILAAKKGYADVSSYRKARLIDLLVPLTSKKDFPIRE